MALTDVWWRGVNGEWTRTTASEADKEFRHSVSVNSYMFRCYKCFQYVTFVKGTARVSSHFKHSRGDSNKSCEDRSVNLTDFYLQRIPLSEFPTRLLMDGSHAALSIGLPPVSIEELEPMFQNKGSLTIACGQYSPAVYRIDPSRFIPNTTNWFALALSSQFHVTISIQPESFVPKLWKLPPPIIPSEGALFDGRTGRRISEKGDVVVGKEYYLLRRRSRTLYPHGHDISILPFHQDNFWTVYKICPLRMSNSASAFFFDELHMRLTRQLSDIDILWPPVVQTSDIIDTKQNRLWVYIHGEQDMQTYPLSGNHIVSIQRISPTQKVYEIINSGSLQMICAERYSQTLQCIYIRPPLVPQIKNPDDIQILDGNDQKITETLLTKVPAGKMLRFLSAIDGTITVSDKDGFCYRKPLPADQETRITDLKKGIKITLRLSCSKVCEVSITDPPMKGQSMDTIPLWHGALIPFPSRYASILNSVPRNSELYQRIQHALKNGVIPIDGYQQLLQFMKD